MNSKEPRTRRGRQPLPLDQQGVCRIEVCLTPREKRMLEYDAGRRGVSLAEEVAARLAERPVTGCARCFCPRD